MASLLHSAEGSTWKKRNHKYLYKEGNRYIYPEDVQRRGGGGAIQRTKNKTARDILSEKGVRRVEYGEYDTGRKPASGLDKEEHGNRYRAVDTKKKNSRYGYEREYTTKYDLEHPRFSNSKSKYDADWRYDDEIKAQRSRDYRAYDQARNRANAGSGRPDYKKLSEQHANREAARNGKVVNPTYTLRDDKGNKVARLQSKDKVQMPTVADYKKASQLTSGAKNRKKMVNNQGSQDYKKLSSEAAKKSKLNSQGSKTKSYDYAKEQDNWNQFNPGTTRAKKKLATYRQGNSLFADDSPYTKKHVTKEMAQRTDDFYKSTGARKYSESAMEKNKEVLSSKAAKKLKDKGYFTVKNGETVFVPSDEITMKKVSKGKQIVDKIKSFFTKSKNKIDDSTREIKAKIKEKDYRYNDQSGRPKSYSRVIDTATEEAKGQIGPTTGKEGVVSLRKGIEAGRKRAGVKTSGDINGLENNLRNKGYSSSTDNEWERRYDQYDGTQIRNKNGNTRYPTSEGKKRWNDLEASEQKFYDNRWRQNFANPNEVEKGTNAGRKRVASENARKTAKATNSRIQSGINAGRTRALKTGDLPTPYTDKRNAAVDVDKYKNMSFTSSEMNKIKSIEKKANSYSPQQDQSRIDYLDSLPKKDRELYFSYIRKQIANSK